MLMVFSINGCFSITHDQHGYPEKVKFSKDGGEKTVSGNIGLDYFSVYTHNQNRESVGARWNKNDSESEQYSIQFKWLTVIHDRQTHQFTLIAEPNTTNKKRMLTIEYCEGDTFMQIDVIQSK